MIEDAFTQSDYAINITDTKGILLNVNDAYLRLYKVEDAAQILGQTQRVIRSPFTPDSLYKEMWSTIASGQVWRGELSNLALDGSQVMIHLTISPIRRNGEIVGYMGFALDRAQQVVLERQLFHANKLVVLGTLGAGLAHELNNPLASILLDVDYLREAVAKIPDPSGRQAAADAAESVLRGCERMRRVLQHLLTYSMNDFEGERSDFPLRGLLEDSLLFVQRKLRSNGIEILVQSAEGIVINGNRTQLESVLHNLMGNSRDAFASRDGAGKWIRIDSFFAEENQTAVIEYRDNAGGIRSEILTRIFEPYFTTKNEHGTGLGLALTRQVLARHGGTIDCVSQGDETLFRITVPARRDGSVPKTNSQAEPNSQPECREMVQSSLEAHRSTQPQIETSRP